MERSTALAIGNFDGVHPGHQALLGDLVERASLNDLEPTVMTFVPHPRMFFSPDKDHRQIYGLRQKALLLREAGVRNLVLIRFDAAFSRQEPEEFLAMLRNKFRIGLLAVGCDYRFGWRRRGDVAMLSDDAERHGYVLLVVDDVTRNSERISSQAIRRALQEGDFKQAEHLLGRPYRMEGRIVRGDGIGGTKFGFPTANLKSRGLPPCEGVFAAHVRIDGIGDEIPAALSVGTRQAVASDGDVRIEAHLLGFSGDIYGRLASVRPICRIREERSYPTLEDLRLAIAQDVAEVRRLTATED